MGQSKIVGYAIAEPQEREEKALTVLTSEKCLKILSKIPFLQAFGDEFLVDILNSSKVHKYSKATPIIVEGTYDSRFFLIISGSVKIIKDEVVVAQLENTGDIFGEIAIIDGCSRSASVISMEDTVCLAVDASILEKLNSRSQIKFCSIFYRLMSEKMATFLRKTTEDFKESQRKLAEAESKLTELKKDFTTSGTRETLNS
jgi:CRP-like cAMP-binding protein